MALRHVVQIANDGDLHQRLAAQAALEGVEGDPVQWAVDRKWTWAVQPGWEAKYDSAQQTGIERPGYYTNVVSDGDILSAVQTVIAAEQP